MKSPAVYGHIQYHICIQDDEASSSRGQFATPSEGKGIQLDTVKGGHVDVLPVALDIFRNKDPDEGFLHIGEKRKKISVGSTARRGNPARRYSSSSENDKNASPLLDILSVHMGQTTAFLSSTSRSIHTLRLLHRPSKDNKGLCCSIHFNAGCECRDVPIARRRQAQYQYQYPDRRWHQCTKSCLLFHVKYTSIAEITVLVRRDTKPLTSSRLPRKNSGKSQAGVP
ncbi:hypothetical protein EDD85DRAFT_941058 [Armillaria nabsnona]|nr:hypothetical protein EDD85DRAFT_941058 [Armillaria nabsnona]